MTKEYYHGATVQSENNAVALGTFDGLHLGHLSVIRSAMQYAKENNIMLGVLLFDRIPSDTFSNSITKQIITYEDKKEILKDVDFLYNEVFDEAFYNMSCKEFVLYLKDTLNASAVFVGFNYRFGKGASGNTKLLEELCKEQGISVFVLPEFKLDGATVSSTLIRKLVQNGEIDLASKYLGREYSILGVVEKGFQNGTRMGFPTVNLSFDDSLAVPLFGVYAGYVILDGENLQSVINVGNNPTFEASKTTIEAHILDFDRELYGKKIRIVFIKRLRSEIKFSSKDELILQIKKDILNSRRELLNYE